MVTIISFVRSTAFTAFFIGLFLLPQLVGAQGLVPDCNGPDCNFCHVVQLGNNVIRWLFMIVFVILSVVIFIAGVKLITANGNQGALSDAKKSITNALIGILIMFSAFLIIDTLMKLAVNGGELKGIGAWNNISCGGQIDPKYVAPVDTSGGVVPVTPSQGCEDIGNGMERCERRQSYTLPPPHPDASCVPSGTGPTSSQTNICTWTQPLGGTQTGGTGVLAEGQLSHVNAVAAMTTAPNITLSSTAGPGGVSAVCTTGSGCTSFTGLREQTAQQVALIGQACPTCQFVVVGGTEPGHAGGQYSHANGYKIDIDDSPTVDAFFQSRLTRAGSRSGDARYLDSCGNEYVRESTHWDITVTNGACAL